MLVEKGERAGAGGDLDGAVEKRAAAEIEVRGRLRGKSVFFGESAEPVVG